MYCCHEVSTQLRLNISYHMKTMDPTRNRLPLRDSSLHHNLPLEVIRNPLTPARTTAFHFNITLPPLSLLNYYITCFSIVLALCNDFSNHHYYMALNYRLLLHNLLERVHKESELVSFPWQDRGKGEKPWQASRIPDRDLNQGASHKTEVLTVWPTPSVFEIQTNDNDNHRLSNNLPSTATARLRHPLYLYLCYVLPSSFSF
jgi:hypothetical protein